MSTRPDDVSGGNWVACMALLAVMLTLGGCELFAYAAQGVVRPKVRARFKLVDRPTMVLVDDPGNKLGDPTLPLVIAAQVGFEVEQSKTITSLVSPDRLHELAATTGSDYRRLPVDRIGRELGAEQVIHVHVESVQLQAEPGLYRPTATVRVKVIDAVEGKRLFPSASHQSDDPGSALFERGEPVTVEMAYRVPGVTPRTEAVIVSRDLATRIGVAVARLFFDYEKDETAGS